MLVGYCVSILLLLSYGFLCWHDNQRKEANAAAIEAERAERDEDHEASSSVAIEWKDLTDKEVSFNRMQTSSSLS